MTKCSPYKVEDSTGVQVPKPMLRKLGVVVPASREADGVDL